MKTTKRILTTLLAVIMLFGVVVIAAEAANLSTTKTNYGYMITTDAKISKAASTVKVYGNYDYINFYINSNYGDMYFFYEIYSDKKMTKMVASDYTYCESSGAYSWSPKIKLKGVFNSGTYYGVTYAAKIDGSGNAKISEPSLQQFKLVVNRKPEFKQQMVILKSVTTTVNGPVVKWSKLSNDVSKYVIYRRNLTGTKWTKVGTVKGSIFSFTDKSAKDKNGKFVYTVRALNKSGVGTRYLYNGLVCLFARAPKISSVSTVSDNRIKVKWNKTADSAYYKVYRSENGGKWKTINSKFKGTTYYDTTAKNGKNYKYTVKAVIRTSYGNAVSAYHNVNKTVDFLNAPKLNPVTVVENGLSITWEKVEGATNYTVFRKTLENGAKWVNLGKVSADVTEYVDTTANEESAFVYTIRSDGEKSKGSYSNKGTEYIKLAEPEVTIESTDTGVKLKWNKVENAQYYEVVKKNTDNTWDLYAVIDGSSCDYEYYSDVAETVSLSVRAVRKDVRSTFDENVPSVKIYPGNTIGIVVYNEYSDITWTDVGADSYNLYKKESTAEDSKYKLIYSGKETKFKDTEVEFDVAYTYLLKGVWNNEEQPVRTTERTYTKYSVAKCLEIKDSYQIIDKNTPDDYMNFPGYFFEYEMTDYGKDKNVYLYAVNKAGEHIFTGSSSQFLNDGNFEFLNDIPTFSFIVSDYNGSSASEGFIVNVETDKCDAVEPTYTTYGDGVKITWKAVDGAVNYIVEKCVYNEFKIEIAADGSTEYSVVIKNSQLEKWGVCTNFKITAIHENGNQTVSYLWDEICFYNNPKLKSAVANNGSIKVTWTGTSFDAREYYYIYRKAEGESKWQKISQVKSNGFDDDFSYTDKNVVSGKKYTYTVRCYDPNEKIYSSYYDTKGITATAK